MLYSTPMLNRRPVFPLLWLACSAIIGSSQTAVSTPPPNVPLRPLVPTTGTIDVEAPEYSVSLKWNDRGNGSISTVTYTNGGDKPLQVLGIQATGNIFVGDYPNKIGAGKTETIAFVYSAADNTDGDVDLIRLLTDQGIKEIRVRVAREKAAKFSSRELHWKVGDAAAAQQVTLTVAANTVTPKKVRVSGGNQAVLSQIDATTWQIAVTPASTAKSGNFVVNVDFDKALPGTAAVILGVIQPRE